MKWYDLLITDEFISYFSNPKNEFYKKVDGKIKYAPLFFKFYNTIEAMTITSNLRDCPEDFDLMFLSYKDSLPYYYEAAVICKDQIPYPTEISEIFHRAKRNHSHLYTVEELAVIIMYHFWERGNYYSEINFLESGNLKWCLLELKKNRDMNSKTKNC